MLTIKEILDEISEVEEDKQEGKFWILFGNYLDYFYLDSRTQEDRIALVEEEPIMYENVSDYLYALTAASINQLCLNYKIETPRWAMSRKYVLKEPHFSMNAKGDLRLILLMESPPAFKMRNLFVTANTLSRA